MKPPKNPLIEQVEHYNIKAEEQFAKQYEKDCRKAYDEIRVKYLMDKVRRGNDKYTKHTYDSEAGTLKATSNVPSFIDVRGIVVEEVGKLAIEMIKNSKNVDTFRQEAFAGKIEDFFSNNKDFIRNLLPNDKIVKLTDALDKPQKHPPHWAIRTLLILISIGISELFFHFGEEYKNNREAQTALKELYNGELKVVFDVISQDITKYGPNKGDTWSTKIQGEIQEALKAAKEGGQIEK